VQASNIVTLLTDFGDADAYVAAVKGALLSASRIAHIVDITHEAPSHDIAAAAWLLRAAYRYFPAGTVHVAVVDPGVGGPRRPIAARAGDWYFVGPDNGVFTWPLRHESPVEAVLLEARRYMRPDISSTFHGRDIFAPVAAHLAAGVPLGRLGPRFDDPVLLDLPTPVIKDDVITGEVAHVDRFGNLITNIDAGRLDKWLADGDARIELCGESAPLAHTYSDAAAGALVALIDSSGMLEVAVREGSAAARLGAARGTPVRVTRAARG
jgi:S-adenosylmethionine hydrolase